MSIFEKERGVCLLAWGACTSKKAGAVTSVCMVPDTDYFITALSGNFMDPNTYEVYQIKRLADHFVTNMLDEGIHLLPFSMAVSASLKLAQSIPVSVRPFVSESEIIIVRRSLEMESENTRAANKTLQIA